MRYRIIVIVIFLILAPWSRSQTASNWQDSVLIEAKSFFKKVDKIEMIQLKPYCITDKRKVRRFGFKKKVQVCREESIINCKNFGDTLICSLDTARIGNKYLLQQDKYNLLFELLYSSPLSNSRGACYNPRHGIIFYDKLDNRIGFLEICFECDQIYETPGTPNMGPTELSYFKKLQELFDDSTF